MKLKKPSYKRNYLSYDLMLDLTTCLHHRSAADHLQVCDLCQVREDFICTPSVKKALSGSRLRFSNGRTAMLLSSTRKAEVVGRRKKKNVPPTIAPSTSSATATTAQRT